MMKDANPPCKSEQDSVFVSHILSPCPLAATGLAWLAGGTICQIPLRYPEEVVVEAQTEIRDIRMMVVFIPDDLFWLLTALHQMVALFNSIAFPLPVLLLGHFSALWLWQSLLKQVAHPEYLSAVRSASADLPYRQLANLLHEGLDLCPRLEEQAQKEELVRGKHSEGLTPRELDAVLGMFHGQNMLQQAKVRNLSVKTLYNQRRAGLKKMADHFPPLVMPFPGIHQREEDPKEILLLSAFERDFVHAIHCGQVFVVFQPVVDSHMSLQGYEILSRWSREGKILSPGEFLPHIDSHYVWLLLTAFTLQAAVNQINKNQNNCYFSVNIPSTMIEGDKLERMVVTARQQLNHPQQMNRLALEIAESTVLTCEKTVSTISSLKKLGVRIMLDDCFSKGSVMFPVRTVHFSDYKLDLSVVNDIPYDEHARALIKSLVYYCGLTGSDCTAEGVDSPEKYRLLKNMGVDYFQGYMISPPVTEDKLETLTRKLLQRKNVEL